MPRLEPFHRILVNNLVQNVTNFTVWFALVFWAFLETHSVFVTGTATAKSKGDGRAG